jgi:GR25 family glycosyltransferase involved in LPS biosynthesis
MIKNAYCLCLDKRKEHWEELKEQCESKGIKFNPFVVGQGEILSIDEYDRFDGEISNYARSFWGYGGSDNDTPEKVKRKVTNHYNAFQSHKEMAKRALAQGDEHVLFLEDDAYFTDRYDEVMDSLKDQLEHLVYDVLYLGWWIGNEGDEFNQKIEDGWNNNKESGLGNASRIGGFHGVILSRRMLDIITRLEAINPIDSQLSKFFHDKIKSYYVMPKIVHDKGIFSECEQSITKRLKL